MADKEPSEIYIETVDQKGNAITIFSTNGELKTASDFAKALNQYESKGTTPAGFVTLPSGGMQETVRRGFENVNQPLQETLPKVGGAIGSVAGMSPLLALGAKAGIIPPSAVTVPASIGRQAGEATGKFVGEQVNTPGKAGVALGTAVTAPAMAIPTTAVGGFSKLALMGNMLKSGIGGAVGGASSRIATGEDADFKKTSTDFATSAMGGGAASVVSHWITKYTKGDIGEKVATEIIDEFTKRFPALKGNPQILDIALKSPQQIERLTAQMSKSLRGGTEEATKGIVADISNTLPSALNKSQADALQGHVRRLVQAQNDRLDKIGNDKTFILAKRSVIKAEESLKEAIRAMYPKVKNIDPTILRVEGRLASVNETLRSVGEGAEVLHRLRQSGAESGWDPMKFAQTIKGEYQSEPGSMLESVGKILGQGRPLTQIPPDRTPFKGEEAGLKALNFIKNKAVPGGSYMPNIQPPKGQQVPWAAPTTAPTGATQAQRVRYAIQDSMKNFMSSETAQAPIRSLSERR